MSGPLIAPRLHAFGCYVRSHSGLRSATATRVRHLTVMGSLSDGGCADASGMLSWYRVSSFLLNHDPGVTQARCSLEAQRNAYIEPWHTRCLRRACPPSSFTAQPSALASLGGIGAVSPGHILAAVAVLRSLASASPHIDIAREQTLRRIESCRDFVTQTTAVLTSMGETDTACRMRSCTSASLPHIGKIALHIAL